MLQHGHVGNNKLFEKVAKMKYLGTSPTNQSWRNEERIKFEGSLLPFSSDFSKKKTERLKYEIIVPLVCMALSSLSVGKARTQTFRRKCRIYAYI